MKTEPLREHFPKGFQDFEYVRSVNGAERNLILVLHGFGGRKDPFLSLPQKLQLPMTSFLIFNAPHELPAELLDDPPGYSWFHYDPFRPLESLEKRPLESSLKAFKEVFEALKRCAWRLDEISLLGHGEGGTLALALCEPLNAVVAVAAEAPRQRGTAPALQIDEQRFPGRGQGFLRGQHQEDDWMKRWS